MPRDPALTAKVERFEVVALIDISAATTRTAANNSREHWRAVGVSLMSVVPTIVGLLGDLTVSAGGLLRTMAIEGV